MFYIPMMNIEHRRRMKPAANGYLSISSSVREREVVAVNHFGFGDVAEEFGDF